MVGYWICKGNMEAENVVPWAWLNYTMTKLGPVDTPVSCSAWFKHHKIITAKRSPEAKSNLSSVPPCKPAKTHTHTHCWVTSSNWYSTLEFAAEVDAAMPGLQQSQTISLLENAKEYTKSRFQRNTNEFADFSSAMAGYSIVWPPKHDHHHDHCDHYDHYVPLNDTWSLDF